MVGHSLECITVQFAVLLKFAVGIAQVLQTLARLDWLCSPQAPGCLRRAPGTAEGAGDAEAAGGERVRTEPHCSGQAGTSLGQGREQPPSGGFFRLSVEVFFSFEPTDVRIESLYFSPLKCGLNRAVLP